MYRSGALLWQHRSVLCDRVVAWVLTTTPLHVLQREVAWALTNIASGQGKHTVAVVEAGGVPALVKLLTSPNEGVAGQAAWALGNIAGDTFEHRDLIIQCGAVSQLCVVRLESATRSRGVQLVVCGVCSVIVHAYNMMECVACLVL